MENQKITREEVKNIFKDYKEILEKESHHDHGLVMDGTVLRWKKNPSIEKQLEKLDLNQLLILFEKLGYGKNSEIYRKLYRDMGYSLSGYWEIFYWESNNELAHEYNPS